MATIDSLKEILNENLDIEPEKVVESATFDELGIDSLDMAELICDIEERLDVEFGEPEGLETVGSLVEYIDSLKPTLPHIMRLRSGGGIASGGPLPPSFCRRRRLLSSVCKEAALFDRNARVAKCAK